MFSTTYTDGWGARTGDRVGGAIARASARTGVDFTYLLHQAKIESGLDPNARARTSSATGLFQFIEQTWLGTVKKHGASHGLGWAADAIQRGADGRYRIADPGMRSAILDMRNDPDAASAMAAEFASDNQAHLEAELGRPMQSVDLYLAHFLGAGGAARFLRAHDANPDAPAAVLMPAAARANRWVFYDGNGAPRSFAEIRDRFAARLGGDGAAPLPPRTPVERALPVRMAALGTGAMGSVPVAPLPSPQYARLAYLMLAELGG
jgi:hypothetical protein